MNYSDKHAIMGMMSSRYAPFDDWNGYVKNKKEVVLFDANLINKYNQYEKISLHYLEKIPNLNGFNITSKYHSNMLISQFNKDFFDLHGKQFIELRETKNKYNKIVKIEYDIKNINIIIDFIQQWNQMRGKQKYGWQLHSGYDTSFFEKYYENEKNNLWSNFFYLNNQLVGYSIISKMCEENCYNYIIRKNNVNFRNLCLYIDYKSFEIMFKEKELFFINWGCSSGSLLKYKKKFPLHKCEKRYFIKIHNEHNTIRQNKFQQSLFD